MKPAITYRDQLKILQDRGLTVTDEPFALHCLEHHNYYRLSAYRFPFCDPSDPDQFKPNTSFRQIWDLYHFDRTLRLLVLEAVKRVEISARSRLAYVIGHELGPQEYLVAENFKNMSIHARTLQRLETEIKRNRREPFIKHHLENLQMTWPPVWVLVEIASFGAVSSLLGQLSPPKLRQLVADTYQMDEKTFCSLFHHLSVLRNTAAHHSRIWNRRFAITFQLPRKKPGDLYQNFHISESAKCQRESKIYNTLVLLVHLMQTIEPTSHWASRLADHIRSLAPALVPDMGFPDDWTERPIWKNMTSSSSALDL